MPGTITRTVNEMLAGVLPTDADPHVRRVYDELRTLAHHRLDHEQHAPFETTDLVHEAYVKLFRPAQGEWRSRAHFFGSAARAMEQLLVDVSRRRRLTPPSTPLTMDLPDRIPPVDPRRLSAALQEMAEQDRELAELARLKIFAGVSISLLAELTSTSERTASRRWTFARTWLYQRLQQDLNGLSDHDTKG
jgi:RNA polymerase sigma factor (TIGR02999 family)